MTLLVPDEGELQIIKIALNNETNENLILELFINDHTPAEGDTTASYTFPTDGVGGYEKKTLTKGSWTCQTVAGVTSATYAQQTWTFTADVGDAYGYCIYGATSGKVFWAEKFAAAEPTYSGKILKLTPYIEFE